MRKRTHLLTILFLILAVLPGGVYAADQSSTSFQLEQTSTTIPMRALQTSTNYSLDSSVSGIVGASSSASFLVNANEGQPVATSTTPVQSGGGGGGSVVLPPPAGSAVLTTGTLCPFYTSVVRLDGLKDASAEQTQVNESSLGVVYPTATTWYKQSHALSLGSNTIVIRGITGSTTGESRSYVLTRSAPGDINRDGRVDDFDLSLLASNWSKNNCQADFNRDGRVDDFDLSILVSAWTR